MQQTTNFGFNKPDSTDMVTDDKFWKANWDNLDSYLTTMPKTQNFTATSASIKANQVILGQTNNVNQPTSPIFLAPSNAQGLGMDGWGNLIPINPSAITSGNNWFVGGKNGNRDFQVYVDGTHKVTTYKNTLDDGSGNATVAGGLTVTGSLSVGSINGMLSMPSNPAHTITGTNTSVAMAANTDTLLPFLPGSPVTQPGEGQWNNGVFTAPADGYYMVSGYVRVTLPLNSSADIKLWKYSTSGTGTFVGPIGRAYNANQSVTQDIVGTGTLVAHLLNGESMKLYINSSSASTTVNMTNSRVTVVKVG